MQIVHSCHAKFHHQDLARQLQRLGVLRKFFTGYPRFKLQTLGVPWDKVDTFPWLEVPYYAGLRYGLWKRGIKRTIEWQVKEVFDRHVAARMPDADVYIGLSCASLHAGRAIQRHGGVYICDRGSSHIRKQDELLEEEFERQGMVYCHIDRRVQEKETAEYEQADAIFVPSEFAWKSFVEKGVPEEKLHKVSYGVDLSRLSKVASPDSGCFDVLFVGGASVRKGVPDLLKAFRDLDHPRKRLRFVGAVLDEVRPFIAAHEAFGDVEVLGHCPQERLREIMSRSHVMVLPSIEEGLALVQAQALACGCPVICTTHTGGADLFTDGDAGFIVPIRAPHEITDRMQRMADDPDLRDAMGLAALRTVERIGGWDAYGDRVVAAVTQICGERCT